MPGGFAAFALDQFRRLGADPHQCQRYVGRFIELDAGGLVWKDAVYQILLDEFDLLGEPSVDFLVAEYVGLYPRFAVETVGATNALRALRSEGLKVAILTNGRSRLQRAVIGALGFAAFANAIIVSEEAGFRKPQPELFAAALRQLDVYPSDTVMVGDSLKSDVEGALGSGIYPIAFCCPFAPDGATLSNTMGEVARVALSRLKSANG